MTYKLFITNRNYSSWSLRPWLLLRALNIPFEEEFAELISGQYRQPQWKAFSPVAHVPCLHDTSSGSELLILWESIAIIEYLAEQHPDKSVYPTASKVARAWARSAVAEMHAGFATIRDEMSMNIGLRVQLESKQEVSEGLKKDLERISELWTEGLSRFGGPWLAGKEFTAVDAFYAPVVLRLQTFVGSRAWLSEVADGYVERVLGREEVKEWVDAALKETGREVLHEGDTVRGRKVLEDLRVQGA
ncbi:hypothetical protein OQA88_6909 [Cercophora sp. LCS_1]